MNLRDVDRLLAAHLSETTDGLVAGPPSSLRRGEGTERNFFILKVDLVGSTQLLMGRRLVTYMRLAHTFLSTADRITQEFGADPDQVEYAGDGLMAYFPERADGAESLLTCAFYVRSAVERMGFLPGTVGALKPRCRMVVHYAPLVVAKIGPRANSILSAIGWQLHRVSKIEKDIAPGIGRATTEFAEQLPRELRRYLGPVYREEQVPVQPPLVSYLDTFLAGQGLADTPPNRLADILYPRMAPAPAPAPMYETRRTLVGYDVRWGALAAVLK